LSNQLWHLPTIGSGVRFNAVAAMAIGFLTFGAACTPTARPLPDVPGEAAQTGPSPEAGVANDWSYLGTNRPETWAHLNEAWKACGEQGTQSPIDVPVETLSASASALTPTSSPSKDTAQAAPAQIRSELGAVTVQASSDGRLVTLQPSQSQTITLDGKLASLQRIELHSPAEHKLGGILFDFELVLFFDGETGPLAASLLMRRGTENPALGPLLELPPRGAYPSRALAGELNLDRLLSPVQLGFEYVGSATTPPCTVGLRRLVLSPVAELSSAQAERLSAGLPPSSARPVQTLGDRPLKVLPFVTIPVVTKATSKSIERIDALAQQSRSVSESNEAKQHL